MKQNKYIQIEEFGEIRKRKTYSVSTIKTDIALGRIEYWPPWKRFCFMPFSRIVLSSDCLEFVAAFLKELNK